MNIVRLLVTLVLAAVLSNCATETKNNQNPSPMEEHIRAHDRVDGSSCPGLRQQLEGILDKPVSVFIPEHLSESDTVDILLHFHGSSSVSEYASCIEDRKLVVVTINLGSGSSKYEEPLRDNRKFSQLLDGSKAILKQNELVAGQTIISGFSAGYGAVRAILSNPAYVTEVDAVILLDGLHTDYQPDGKTLFEGGQLNAANLEPFLSFAQLAADGKKQFVFTHSSIFPGTYSSTTECADYLIKALALKRISVLKSGPLGMQLLGETEKKGLKILAFAGNTAPDHIDHLHGLYAFLDLLLK